MNTQHTSSRLPSGLSQHVRRRVASLMAAFLATMVSLPASAVVTFPDTPLQSGTPFPPANIMFVLDNSGSMALVSMPFDVEDYEYQGTSTGAGQTGLNDDPHDRSYLNNTIYYDPSITYRPWLTSDGITRLSGGTSISSVYTNWNLANSSNFGSSPTVAGTRDLRGNDESIFYVPKTGITASTNPDDFDRYRVNSSGQVVVAVYTRTQISGFPHTGLSSSSSTGNTYSITVPANATKIETNTTGGGTRVDLRIVDPSSNTQCQSKNGNNAESCSYTIPTSTPGTWQIQVRRDGTTNYTGVTVDAYITTMTETVQTPPQGGSRTQANELTNIATWYSYYRTRIKTAKGGASEAFGKLGPNFRVGFTNINGRAAGLSSASSSSEVIPTVGTFTTTNKINWFSTLTSSQVASGSTPLPSALWDTGAYFTRTDDHGPWGPSPQISCRQSFAILTTDGFWNSNISSAGDSDGTNGAAIVSKDTTHTFTYTPVNPYKDNFVTTPHTESNTLADVASYYWKTDLRTTLDNDVPTSDPSTEYWQHMVTFSVAIGLSGTLDPSDIPGLTAGSVHWPDPITNSGVERIDDLMHAAVNGHGSFVSANNPTEFAQALSSALGLITARKGSASNVSTNSTSFQTDTRVYQARYWSSRWTGEMAAYSASSSGVAAEPVWQASQLIPATRNIITWNPSGTPKGRAFPGGLTSTELATLDVTTSRPLAPATGAENAAYIAGNTSLESRNNVGELRDRQINIRVSGHDVLAPTVLGDIVNSTPFYVQELQTLFVGANDGMLHAFDAVTGVEKFAYIPGSLSLANLATLSDPDYGTAAVLHRYFVDGPVVVSTTQQTPSHNYLVGSLGRGGHGVFGLDVTNPSSFTNANVLWETESWTGATAAADIADMGNVLGEPLIVTLNDATNTKAVIVGNGPNSANGHSVLFVINLATGARIAKIDAGANLGLSAPRGWDNDGNGTVDFVYAGDLNGNIWKFDFRGTTAGSWVIARGGNPLYIARDANNVRQPITAGLALAKEPVSGHRWVFAGTGKFLENSDLVPANFKPQSMYGLIDDDDAATVAITGRTSGGDGTLQQRSILVDQLIWIDVNGDGVANSTDGVQREARVFDVAGPLDSSKKGWYLDMLVPPSGTQKGERIVSNPRVFGTVLVTASLIPPTPNSCDAGGSGFINALNAFTGTSLPVSFFNANLTMSGGVANFADDTLTSGTNAIGIGSVDLGLGMPTLPTMIDNLLVAGGSQGTIGSVSVNPQGPGARRVSWREIEKD